MTDRNRFEDKVALITGGASGIGSATAVRLANEGAHVVIADVDKTAGLALASRINGHFLSVDLTDSAQIETMVADVLKMHNRLDILINNAGIGVSSGATTPELEPEIWHKVMAVNLDALFHTCRFAIPAIRRQGGGAIVNTASISGLCGDFGFTAYNASKGAVINYTRALALDHAKDGIRINAVCPGVIETPMSSALQSEEMAGYKKLLETRIPMGRIGQAEEIANVIAFLASEEASYLTGSMIVADGGIMASTGQPSVQEWLAIA